jgi:hypothetical protein
MTKILKPSQSVVSSRVTTSERGQIQQINRTTSLTYSNQQFIMILVIPDQAAVILIVLVRFSGLGNSVVIAHLFL